MSNGPFSACFRYHSRMSIPQVTHQTSFKVDSEPPSRASAPTVGALGEAQLAGNGRTLVKSCNAAMVRLGGSLRARR